MCFFSRVCFFEDKATQKKEQKIGGRKKYTLKRQTTLEINFLKIRSNEQLIKNYYRHYSRSKSDACEVNVSDSEIRKLKIVSLRMLVTVKQDNKKTRDSCCVFLNFLNFFSPLLLQKFEHTSFSPLCSQVQKNALVLCL